MTPTRAASPTRLFAPALAFAVATTPSCTKDGGVSQPAGDARSAPAADAPAQSGAPPVAPSASGSGATAAGPAASTGVPRDLNVLVISIDSLRSDMPWNGYGRDIAPTLAKFE